MMNDFCFEGKNGLLLRGCRTFEGNGMVHAFTTRPGGSCTGDQSSFNVSYKHDVPSGSVDKNHALLKKTLGYEKLCWADQVHGVRVFTVEADTPGGMLGQGDALITDVPGTALMVFSADCIPILLYDRERRAVGAVHSGWRGTAQAVAAAAVEEMMRQFGCFPGNIRAAIGPGIGSCCFLTHDDVPDAMREAFGSSADAHMVKRGGQWAVDLKGIVRDTLLEAGVREIYTDGLCSCCHEPLLWSHRRSGSRRGLQGAVIALR